MSQCSRIGHIWHGETCNQCGAIRTFEEWLKDFRDRLLLSSITGTSLTISGSDAKLLEWYLPKSKRE